jgi:hypothetical protein
MDLFFEDDQTVGRDKKDERDDPKGRARHILDLGSAPARKSGQSKQGEQQSQKYFHNFPRKIKHRT